MKKLLFLLLAVPQVLLAQTGAHSLLVGKWLLVEHKVQQKDGKKVNMVKEGDVRSFEFGADGSYVLTFKNKDRGVGSEKGKWHVEYKRDGTPSLILSDNGRPADDPGAEVSYWHAIERLNTKELVMPEYIYDWKGGLLHHGISRYEKQEILPSSE